MAATLNPLVWIAPIVLLVLFWPISQQIKHDRLKPVAAYLLFTSVFALVGGVAFMLALWAGATLLPQGTMAGPLAAGVTVLVAVLPALGAAVWIVRKPQKRRMPR